MPPEPKKAIFGPAIFRVIGHSSKKSLGESSNLVHSSIYAKFQLIWTIRLVRAWNLFYEQFFVIFLNFLYVRFLLKIPLKTPVPSRIPSRGTGHEIVPSLDWTKLVDASVRQSRLLTVSLTVICAHRIRLVTHRCSSFYFSSSPPPPDQRCQVFEFSWICHFLRHPRSALRDTR